jgi:hypothetical protein
VKNRSTQFLPVVATKPPLHRLRRPLASGSAERQGDARGFGTPLWISGRDPHGWTAAAFVP